MKQKTQLLGTSGELAVCNYLKKEGFTILETQFRVRGGEVDIIALDQRTLVGVEVKTRQKRYFATSQVITPTKQEKVINATVLYAMQNKHSGNIRFDVAIVIQPNLGTTDITYYKNAFQSEKSWLI